MGISAAPAACWLATDHSWTFPSSAAAASSAPSGLNVTASTAVSSELIGAPISWPVAVLHSRMPPSAPPLATVLPSGLNVTVPAWAAPASGRVVIAAWPARVQLPTVLASAASSTLPPSAKARASGAAPKVATPIVRCPARSHSRIVPPEYPAASSLPSGL